MHTCYLIGRKKYKIIVCILSIDAFSDIIFDRPCCDLVTVQGTEIRARAAVRMLLPICI